MKDPKVKVQTVTDVSAKPQYGGLCLTCDHARSCTYPRDPERPVLQCEEFEAYDMPVERATVEDFLASGNVKAQAASNHNGDAESRGLCANCENRKTCTFPRPEEGVWHCEEYA
jgi:hypothetical protein